MQKTISLLIFMLALLSDLILQPICSMEESTHILDPNNRPEYVKNNIDRSHKASLKHDLEDYFYRGRENYTIISESQDNTTIDGLIQSQIKQGQSELNILDVGAGNFAWGRYLAKRINNFLQEKSTLNVIHVNIISLTGEPCNNEEITQNGNCTLYEFSGFKIEDLHTELEKRQLYLKNKIDLAVSSWTFVHLVDPLGTLQLLLNLMRPETGFLMINQWNNTIRLKCDLILIEDNGHPDTANILYIAFINSGLNVLIFPYEKAYVIKRKTSEEISLPFSYDPIPLELKMTDPNKTNGLKSELIPNPHYIVDPDFVYLMFHLRDRDISKSYGSNSIADELFQFNQNFEQNMW